MNRLEMKLCAAALALIATGACQAQDKLSLVLNWLPGADHAPIFYAQQQGWYKQAGVDLKIENGKGSSFAAQKISTGESQLGIIDMMTAFDFRGKGAEMTAVMAIYANSPFGFYWKKSSGIKSPKDFAGKRIGTPPGDAARTVWSAISKSLGVSEDSVKWVNVAPEGKIAALQTGAIDITQHFYSVNYVYERTFGPDLGFVAMRDVGFNPYSNAIFVNPKAAKDQAAAVKKFISVTQRAYVACIETPAPCIAAVSEAASQKSEDVEASWRDTKPLLIDANSKITFGSFDPKRMTADYQLAKSAYKDMKDFPVTDFYTNDFLDKTQKVK